MLVVCAFSAVAAVAEPFEVGHGPVAVAVADLDADGILDIVVANGGDTNVTVLLGDGAGGFAEPAGSPFEAGQQPNDIAVADLDGDGTLDLAFPNHEADHVSVLLGAEEGRFAPASFSPVRVRSQPHPHGIAAADLDGDGAVDLVVESFGEDLVEVLWGRSDGFSVPGGTFDVGRLPYQRVRTADVNGDGRPDIVTTNREGASVTVLLAQEGRVFAEASGSPVPVAPSPFGHALADANGDGCSDLAIGHYSGNIRDRSRDRVSILLGDCRGGFRQARRSPFSTCAAPTSVAIGDVNGDGHEDVATACYGSDDVEVLLGSAAGEFEAAGTTIAVGAGPLDITLADLDGDGRADIVTADSKADTITVVRRVADAAGFE